MDVRLSAEQRALRDAVAQVVDRHGPASVADLADSARQSRLEAAVAGAGWRELRCPAGGGAPWASAVEVALVVEELGRGLADVAFAGPTLAADLRRLAGAELAPSPETVVMAADLATVGTAGELGVAIDAAGAQHALVVDAADRLGVIPLATTGAPIDLTRPHAVTSEDAMVAVASGELPSGALDRWTAFGLALSCADLIGAMRGATTLATDYAGVRQQYGAVIGSFQAVQHLLADAFAAMEGSRSIALHAAWAVDALPADEALAAAATAKAYCARAARMVCETSIQVHGGIGNTWECLAHVYLRRALVSIDLFGGVGVNLERVLTHHEVADQRVGGVTHGLR